MLSFYTRLIIAGFCILPFALLTNNPQQSTTYLSFVAIFYTIVWSIVIGKNKPIDEDDIEQFPGGDY